jgi:hypothetical protein
LPIPGELRLLAQRTRERVSDMWNKSCGSYRLCVITT